MIYRDYRWTPKSYGRVRILQQYEPLQPLFLRELARAIECDCFLDVGANVGPYSLLMTALPKVRKVIAFEPAPVAARELLANVYLNGLGDKIEVVAKGVSSSGGEAVLGVMKDAAGRNGLLATSIHKRAKFRQHIVVPTTTIDTLDLGDFRVLCVKIDVEGHELEVLRGGRGRFGSHPALIQVENLRGRTDVATELSSLGYRLLTQIGPDHYWSNIVIPADTLVTAYSRAAKFLIANTRRPPLRRSKVAEALDKVRGWVFPRQKRQPSNANQ